MISSTLASLLNTDDDFGGTSQEEDAEHDELTAKLGAQIAELEGNAATAAAEMSKLGAETKVLAAELKQRQSAQRGVTQDVRKTLTELVEKHE